jgi:hypothetical protein
MVKCCVFFAVRTELLYVIWASFGFEGLISAFYNTITARAPKYPVARAEQRSYKDLAKLG